MLTLGIVVDGDLVVQFGIDMCEKYVGYNLADNVSGLVFEIV